MQTQPQPQNPIDLKRFFLTEKLTERLTLPNFQKNLLDETENGNFDEVKVLHGKPFLTPEGRHAQEIVGFSATNSKKRGEPEVFLHYTPEEEIEQEETLHNNLKLKLKQKIQEKKEERTSKE
jgi:hypothetical protein